MREIEFRGLRTDGKGWIYGDLYTGLNGSIYLNTVVELSCTSRANCQIEVHPESVGQYTGLKDKNGTKIFEGDIIVFGDKNIKQYVVFRKGQFMAKQLCNAMIGLGYCDWELESTVTGNIHDKN